MKLFSRQNLEQETDEGLMALLANGDSKALAQLYHRYADKVYGYLLKAVHFDAEKAADLLQDVFLKVAEKPLLFQANKSFKVWLFAVATNHLKNEWRNSSTARLKQEEIAHSTIDFYEETFSEAIDQQLLQQNIQAAIAELSAIQQQLLHLRYSEECSVPQIAEIMNIPEGTVKSRLYYSIKQLSEKLNAYHSIQEK